MPETLSIVVVIKNRTKFLVQHGTQKLTLKLFENNLDMLFKMVQNDNWQLVVIDFNSSDVNMADFLKDKFESHPESQQNFKYTLHTMNDDKFCKGKGLNIAPSLAEYDNMFFIDADMLITSRHIFNDGYKALREGKAYFPICMSYTSPQQNNAKKRPYGTGNVFITKKLIAMTKWGEYKKWGNEDTHFYNFHRSKKLSVRSVIPTFFHQWHPNNLTWKNRFY